MDFSSIFEIVQPVINQIEENGDEALKQFTSQFDGVELDAITIDPASIEINLFEPVQQAIDVAFENILYFHKEQMPAVLEVETMPGVRCSRVTRPIERVGLYVPGGTAILPSSAMMLAIPAMLARCKNIVLATPPDKHGSVAPEIAYIAQKAGVNTLFAGRRCTSNSSYGFWNRICSKS